MSRWFIPNPASVSPGVLAAQVVPPGTGTLLTPSAVGDRLREFFFPGTASPLFLSCQREGLLQMALEWFSDRKILMLVNGPMSQEWYDIADDCGGDVTVYDWAYGADLDPDAFRPVFMKERFDLLMYVETDVFTGCRPVPEKFCGIFRELCPDGLIVADISGSVFCGMDAMITGCADICLCASEMAMGLPPGLGTVILNERAHTRLLAHNVMNGRYFNYPRQTVSRSLSALDVTPYSLLNALNEQIDIVLTEGMDARVKRMAEVRNWIWQWLLGRGFSVLSAAEISALNATAMILPVGVSAADMAEFAKGYGIFVRPGLGLMQENSLILYHGNDATVADAQALTRVLDRFLADYDTRRRRNMPAA